ncbi:MAG TPA: hypothetical protein VFD05_01660 [Bacilli bacterium]|nr:hypothetical protein [Bacilli bacterium]
MTKYYSGNSIINLISSVQKLKYPPENIWILVYGNRKCDPKVILLLSGYSRNDYNSMKLNRAEKGMLFYVKQLSERTGVPYIYVRFNRDETNISEVYTLKREKLIRIKLDKYIEKIESFGIERSYQASKKPINSKASNSYHLWQINSGLDIITTDIDLMRVNQDLQITEVYELKRSTLDIDKWKPYPADFNNFIMLSKLLNKAQIKFYILFNQYRKEPFVDDIKTIKLYEVMHDEKLEIKFIVKQNISDFLLNI